MTEHSHQKVRRPFRSVVFTRLFAAPFAVLLAVWFFVRSANPTIPGDLADRTTPKTFDGSSDQLRRTVIVPTLDTPVPEGKNAVWCSSFQLSWNKLKIKVAGGAIKVLGAEAISESLNTALQSEADISPGDFYTAAGRNSDGILDTIRADMGRLFPGVPVSDLPEAPNGVTAYAYLQARVKFELPFFEEPNGFWFPRGTNAFSPGANVGGFGLIEEHTDKRLRAQVEVLYESSTTEYALDLCRTSQPNQLIIARIKPGNTLGETLIAVETKIGQTPRWKQRGLDDDDTLRVTNMNWRIAHQFRELEGPEKRVLDGPLRGLYISSAFQVIEFKLDRGGALLASRAGSEWADGHHEYHFDRPFLLYFKKRDAKHPFFVVWIENDELLERLR